MQAETFFRTLLLLVASFAWTQKLEYNFMIEDHLIDPYVSFEVIKQQRIDNRSHLSIALKEDGQANISWNGAKNNLKSLVIISMKFPNNTYSILMKTIEVPRGFNTVKYKFEYNATYDVRLFKRSLHKDGLYLNVINQTVSNVKGIDSQINFKRENCTGGLLTWPAFTNVTSYHLIILNHRDTGTYMELDTILPASSNSYRHKFKILDKFEMIVVYNFQHTLKTLVLKRTLRIGSETCYKYETLLNNKSLYIYLYCNVLEEDKKCYKRLSLDVRKHSYSLFLNYDEEKKCFFYPNYSDVASEVVESQFWKNLELKYVSDKNGCVDFLKSFNYNSTEIMKEVESFYP